MWCPPVPRIADNLHILIDTGLDAQVQLRGLPITGPLSRSQPIINILRHDLPSPPPAQSGVLSAHTLLQPLPTAKASSRATASSYVLVSPSPPPSAPILQVIYQRAPAGPVVHPPVPPGERTIKQISG